MNKAVGHMLSVAPMMDWTDRHCRYLHRLASRYAVLYTEMVTAPAVIHGERDRLLGFDEAEHPVVCQLGGSDPQELAQAARVVAEFGYDEINLNVGCPSDRVQSGMFGACLMANPDLVGACVAAMREAVDIPVTVKCRIGIDDRDDFPFLLDFVDRVHSISGCDTFIIHARVAILAGLSPKQNRDVPPLHYGHVHRLKRERPNLSIEINGGITSLEQARDLLTDKSDGTTLQGVMIGRAAYQTPDLMLSVDAFVANQCGFEAEARAVTTGHDLVRAYLPYIDARLSEGVRLQAMTRHMIGLFQGVPGARAFRRYLSENAHKAGAGPEVVEHALSFVPEDHDVLSKAS